MSALVVGVASAFWLGILTSISPCPLATNVAAVSLIGRRVGSPRAVLLSGLFYAAGRTLAYLALAILLVAGLLSQVTASFYLLKYVNRALGPILILVGMVLLDLIPLRFSTFSPGERTQRSIERLGIWGAALAGILFALAFCPVSAGIFFLGLIPLAVELDSRLLLPAAYGMGTALPVLAFAFVIALSAQSVGKFFNRLTRFELWARRLTGVLFILIGIYYSLVFIYRVW